MWPVEVENSQRTRALDRWNRPGFAEGSDVPQVLRLAIPAGIIAGATALAAFYLARNANGATLAQSRSITTVALAIVALAFIPCTEATAGKTQRRLPFAIAPAAVSALLFPIVFAVPALRTLYDLSPLHADQYALAAGVGATGAALLLALTLAVGTRDALTVTTNSTAPDRDRR